MRFYLGAGRAAASAGAGGRPHHRGDFRILTFANEARLWGTQNPRFFEGTRVAKEPAAVLAAAQTRPSRLTVELLWRAPLGNSDHSPIARLTSGGAAKRGHAVKFISRTETRVALRR